MTPDKTPPTLDPLQRAGALAVLTHALHADPTYAWEWQCALVESQRQAGIDGQPAQTGAAHFLRTHFGVDITITQAYHDLMQTWR